MALHQAVAASIARDPSVIEHARSNLARWEQTAPGPWIGEWRALLNSPLETLVSFLGERSERADRLRQSSPFAGVLCDAERRRIYESFAT